MSQGTNPSPDEQNAKLASKMIRQEIKRILDGWDPLAMKGLPGFDREYAPHVGPLLVMVKKEAPVGEISAHLHRLMTEEWQLPPDREKCFLQAEKIHRTGMFIRPQ